MTTINTTIGQATGRSREIESPRTTPVRSRFETWWIAFQSFADFFCIAVTIVTANVCVRAFVPNLHIAISNTAACLAALLGVATLASGGAYNLSSSILDIHGMENVLRSAAIGFAIVVSALFIHGRSLASLRPAIAIICVLPALLLERTVTSFLVRRLFARGYGLRRVLVYGSETVIRVVRECLNTPELRMSCVASVEDTGEPAMPQVGSGNIVRGTWDDVADVLRREQIDEILVADPNISREKVLSIIARCEALQLPVSFVPDPFGIFRSGFNSRLLYGNLCLTYRQTIPALAAFSKRVVDVFLSSILIVLLSPALLLIALLSALDSSGPVIFRQERVGRDGHLFPVFKFRTMHVASPAYERSPTDKHDPRITRIGRVLRRTSLDELPQLFNVFLGHMSLVGPRPEMPFIVEQYGPAERGRLRVKPGVTGLWQISHARPLPIHHSIGYDLYYIERHNIFMDIAIMLATIGVVLRGRGLY